LLTIGKWREAEAAYRDAVDVQKQLAADFPKAAEHRQELARRHSSLGGLLQRTGRAAEAESAFRAALAVWQQLVAEFPAVPEHRQGLAGSQNGLGVLLYMTRRPEEAEKLYRDALTLQKQLVADLPKVADYRNELAGTMVNLALVLLQRGDVEAARKLLLEAQPHHEAALKDRYNNPVYRQYFRNNRLTLIEASLRLKKHAEAANLVREVTRDMPNPGAELYYRAASFLARCAALAEQDQELPEARRQELAQSYAAWAYSDLRSAVNARFRDLKRLKEDKDLDSLRSRKDFQMLLAELEADTKRNPR
jgi:tetratricopeptide (TPR) repeat protein